jgi:hypothetical protein
MNLSVIDAQFSTSLEKQCWKLQLPVIRESAKGSSLRRCCLHFELYFATAFATGHLPPWRYFRISADTHEVMFWLKTRTREYS